MLIILYNKEGDIMARLVKESIHEIEIEKSRFICYVNRVFSELEAKEYIQTIKKLHPTATHHCSAFLIGEHQELQRSNDDGEPSGTAGVPILECLKKNQMEDIVAVVVRYFGGIKLGTGGLIRAYSKSVSENLKIAPKTRLQKVNRYLIAIGYDMLGRFDYYITQHPITVTNKTYEEQVIIELITAYPLTADIQEIASGKALIQELGDETIEIEWKE